MRLLPVLLAVLVAALAAAEEPPAGAPAGALAAVVADAMRHLEAGELEVAEALLLDVRGLLPEHAEAAFYLGRVYLTRGEAQAAVQAIEEATRLDPGSSTYQFWLGDALVARIHEIPALFKLAVANRMRMAYQKAVELDPENLEARAAVARYHLQAPPVAGGDPALADAQIEEIARRDPALAQILIDEREGRREPLRAPPSMTRAPRGIVAGVTAVSGFCHGY